MPIFTPRLMTQRLQNPNPPSQEGQGVRPIAPASGVSDFDRQEYVIDYRQRERAARNRRALAMQAGDMSAREQADRELFELGAERRAFSQANRKVIGQEQAVQNRDEFQRMARGALAEASARERQAALDTEGQIRGVTTDIGRHRMRTLAGDAGAALPADELHGIGAGATPMTQELALQGRPDPRVALAAQGDAHVAEAERLARAAQTFEAAPARTSGPTEGSQARLDQYVGNFLERRRLRQQGLAAEAQVEGLGQETGVEIARGDRAAARGRTAEGEATEATANMARDVANATDAVRVAEANMLKAEEEANLLRAQGRNAEAEARMREAQAGLFKAQSERQLMVLEQEKRQFEMDMKALEDASKDDQIPLPPESLDSIKNAMFGTAENPGVILRINDMIARGSPDQIGFTQVDMISQEMRQFGDFAEKLRVAGEKATPSQRRDLQIMAAELMAARPPGQLDLVRSWWGAIMPNPLPNDRRRFRAQQQARLQEFMEGWRTIKQLSEGQVPSP